MKIKNFILILCFFMGFNQTLFGQKYVVDKGATIFSGTFNFSNAGGSILTVTEQRTTTIYLTGSVNHFLFSHFFAGGSIEYSHMSQGKFGDNSINIGPQVGYAFGNEKGTIFPYVDAGIRYKYLHSTAYSNSKANGSDTFVGLGVIVPLKRHIGLVFEGSYHMISIKYNGDPSGSHSGNIISLGIGVSGLLF